MHPFGLGALLLAGAAAQAPQVHESVIVTASRLPAEAAAPRRTVVLEREEIARLPVESVQELIALLAGVSLMRRGPLGAQADVMLRGATFEQVAVLVDGVRVNDPQTGHFNLDLAVDLEAVERVEVTLGPGSAVHGPDAFGGTIAITTAAPSALRARLGGGQHGLWQAGAALPVGGGAWVSASRVSHDGFRPHTELDATRASLGWSGKAAGWSLRTTFGGEDKQFGAWAYYSARYPDQWEETDTALWTFAASRPLGSTGLSVRAGARQHHDLFVLERARPDWYRNRHRSRSGSLQATLDGEAAGLRWVAGLEGEVQGLDSARLGDHRRERVAAFAEGSRRLGRVLLSAQLRGDRTSDWGWELDPGLGVEIELGRGVSCGLHRGRSFRQPSFTDLHYVSPATVGNPALRPEHAWSDEALLRVPVRWTLLELSVFRRDARDLIDYLRGDDGVYRAANHARVVTRGGEVSLALAPWRVLAATRVWASWLDSEVDVDPSRSRYALSHPRAEAGASTRAALPAGITADVSWRWRDPRTGPSYSLVDARLSRGLRGGFSLEVGASNLLGTRYEELDGILMPGRWVTASVAWHAK
ncbi:MAG: TonB-dependent receptor [Thermoanaerobaculaceae bacterium]|nr:TonB-dependent receptor [Thermoanaerobaculaceae bacterium]MDI9622876.1 TonB-dependent receptor [Acidobacteriota bacterium]HPW54388.1 TonB-dependent receptor [Thermoanaerobaculaceae bacterium]